MTKHLVFPTVVVVAVWTAVAVGRGYQVGASPRDVAPYVYAPLILGLGGWVGWRIGRRIDPRVVGVIVTATASYIAFEALTSGHPGRGAIGYANANAAVAVQLMGIAALVALHPASRAYGLVGVAVGAVGVLANASQGGAMTGVLVLLALLTALSRWGRRRWQPAVAALGICAAAVGGLVGLARAASWAPWTEASLSVVRREMWNAAWVAFRRAEVFGLGPGGYAQVNPWAFDTDTSAAHSLPLQVAAELGGAGLALLTLLFLCGLAWAVSAYSSPAAWITAAAWTALTVHSFMDHLLEYWPVPLAAGLVLGYGLVAQPDAEAEDEVVQLLGTPPRGA